MDRMQAAIAAIVIILIIAIGSFMFISSNSHNTKIDVLSNNTLKNGDFITVLLTDEYRNVYSGEIIDIKVLDDSGWAHKYEVTTDDEGQGSIQLEGLDNGNYTLHCNFNGTLYNKASKSVTPLEINDGMN